MIKIKIIKQTNKQTNKHTLETNNKWYAQVQRLCCLDDSFGYDVTLHNATEDVDQDRFDLNCIVLVKNGN